MLIAPNSFRALARDTLRNKSSDSLEVLVMFGFFPFFPVFSGPSLQDNLGTHRKHGEVTEQERQKLVIVRRRTHLVEFKPNRCENKAKLDMPAFGL